MIQNFDKIEQESKAHFQALALAIYQYQCSQCTILKKYNELIPSKQNEFTFLPIAFFKTHEIVTHPNIQIHQEPLRFKSSGTSSTAQSTHIVLDKKVYIQSFMSSFKSFFGPIEGYCILALLPSYLENGQSSLVYMVEYLIHESKHRNSGFYLYNHEQLFNTLQQLELQKQKTILFGVTYALLDFAEKYNLTLNHTTIIETGGMKGRKEELTREEVHQKISQSFNGVTICSEYGMTELLSQAYMVHGERFACPPWMKVLVRDINDPLDIKPQGKGAINIIDLANIHSCSFIATEDVGEVFEDGSFVINGRLDNSELRGCSLLAI